MFARIILGGVATVVWRADGVSVGFGFGFAVALDAHHQVDALPPRRYGWIGPKHRRLASFRFSSPARFQRGEEVGLAQAMRGG